MRFRRFLGLLVTFTMAHIAVVGSDLVCARHSAGPMTHADAMPGMEHGQPAGQSEQKMPCKTPSRDDCCQALTSCAASAAMASVVAVSAAAIATSSVQSTIDDVPLSRVAAPEPPPPKA